MLPFGIGAGEVILIMVVVLLVMGPGKLPEIARAMGKGVRVLRRAGQELKDAIDVEDEVARIRSWEMPDPISETAEVEAVADDPHDDGGYHDEHGRFHPHETAAEASETETMPYQGPVKREEGTVVPVSNYHQIEGEGEVEPEAEASEATATHESGEQSKDSEG